MNLRAYFDRIGFSGDARPDLPTLSALHRAQQQAVPFENLDVQLGRPLTIDLDAAYAKVVERPRGGWCYELNGLFGHALEMIGFDVRRLSAGVMREHAGDMQMGNHLCLRVELDRPYLADVGFGGTLADALPLTAGEREDAPFQVSLAELGTGYWRFIERGHGEPFSFDFRPEPADESLLAAKCHELQTSPASPFVQNLVVQRRQGATQLAIRGRVFSITSAAGVEKTLLESPDALLQTLRAHFAIDLPEVGDLWPAICARHAALFPS